MKFSWYIGSKALATSINIVSITGANNVDIDMINQIIGAKNSSAILRQNHVEKIIFELMFDTLFTQFQIEVCHGYRSLVCWST